MSNVTTSEIQLLKAMLEKIKIERKFMAVLKEWCYNEKVNISEQQAKEMDEKYTGAIQKIEQIYGKKCYSGNSVSFEAIIKGNYAIALKSGDIDLISWAMDKTKK